MEAWDVVILVFVCLAMDFAALQNVFLTYYASFLKNASFWLDLDENSIHRGLVIGGAYLVFLLVFGFLWKGTQRRKNRLEKELVTQIDEMIFLLAKYQHVHTDTQSLGGNPHIALMRSIFTEGNCDYIRSSKLILDNMHKVEQLLSQKVISEEREKKFKSDLRIFKVMQVFEMIFRVMVAIPTLWIALLFA